jgi:hypothetical protein
MLDVSCAEVALKAEANNLGSVNDANDVAPFDGVIVVKNVDQGYKLN